MSQPLARIILIAVAITLAACTSLTGPARSDCSGGVTGGSENC